MRERELFLAACEIDDVENRFEYLQEACGDDSVLRKRVEDLLAIDREERNLFNQSPLEAAASHLAATAEECEGTILGRYKLLEKIGEGGFALVYMAEQTEPVRRQVAVKVIKAGMDTKQVIARFEAERQALGLMDHPNIAKVYDGGTTPNGRPYFVMELVRGSRITEFCDAQRLTTAERMGVFLQVCRAVQHAHQKGIIHRDLKPSNILVAIHDDAPAPKVIDFGIAKAIEQPLTDRTLFTRFHQFIGTPAYMSPEQATLGGSDIDTRTDVYSLGAVLYELLTGVAPIDARQLEKVAFDEVSRIIREDQPTLPSARISTLGVRQQSVAANRGIDPQGLQRFVRGDLDWIIMKALEKDRSRRYDTVSALAADVQHFLADEPVLACPPSPWYRFRKLVRRNRGPVLAALLVLVALLAGIIGTSWQWRRAEANLNEANKAGERLQDQLWQSLFQQARAQIYSGQPGQRHKALEAVREAARIRRSPELRDLAIAALARTDIRLGKQWARTPAGTDFLVFDADLEWHAWADVNGTVSVRRVADDQVLVSLYDPAYMGALLRFSADQKYLAVAYGFSPQRYLDVWDLERSDKLVLKQPVYANGFDFTPDSRQVAVAQGDGAIGLFDLGTSALLRPLGKGPVPNDLVISPDGTRLAVSQAFGPQVQVRDLATGDVQVTVAHPEIEAYDLAWHSHDPNLLATASLGIYLWDLRFPEKPIATLPGQAGPTTNIAFSHDGGILASKGWVDTSVRLWDAWTGRQLVQIPGTSAHGDIPLQFSRDDRLLAFYSNGTHIGLWELEVAREFRSLGSHASRGQGNYPSLDISSDGRLLVASSRYGSSNGIRLWDLDTGKELAFLPVGPTFAVRFHPGGGALFSSHSELGVCVWPLRGGRERLHVGPPRRLGPARTAAQLSVSADGRRLAVVYEDCGMVFELAEPAPFPVVGLSTGILSTELLSFLMNRDEPGVSFVQGHVNQVAFSPDAHWLATAMSGGAGVMVFDVKTRKHVKTLPALLYSGAEFSPDPDGKWLVTSAADEYCIYETGTWERRHVLPRTAGGDSPGPVAFTPDGKVLAVVLNGVTVELRDPATARVLATLEPPEPDRNLPSVLRFSPDGSQLAVCTTELRILYVWDLRLLGQRLAELGQDWELPDFSAAPASGVRKPLKVEVNLGDFAAQEHRQNSRDHLRARDWQSAFDEASKAIELSEDDAEAWRLRALARMALKEYELAVADFRQALKLGLQDALALNNIAWELVVTPDAPPNLVGYSVDWAKAAVDLQPTQAFYWNTLGVAHYRAGDFKAAIKALETAEELKPDTAFAFNAFFLAMAHWQLDAKDLARQWFDRAIDWMEKRPAELQNSPVWQEELRGFRSEAESLMGIETK